MATPFTHLIVTQRAAVGGRWGRRRAGLEFGRAPRAVYPADLGEGLKAAINLAQLLEDPMLSVATVDADGAERPVTDEDVAGLRALIEAEAHRVNPGNPPTPEAALGQMEDTPREHSQPAGAEQAAPAAKAARAKTRPSGRAKAGG